jgi:hypothetical protein
MWLRSTSEVEVDRCIALLVRRSRGAHRRLRKSRAVRYSSDLPVDRPKPHDSSHAVAPTTGSNPTRPANSRPPSHPEGPPGALPPRRAAEMPLLATLLEVPSPATLVLRRVHSTPACLTGYVPPTGFYTLSTVCSSPERPALFHAGNAHGVLLSRGFPSLPGSVTHRLGITLLTFLHRTKRMVDARRPCSTRRNALLEPFPPPGPCSNSESVPPPGLLRPWRWSIPS